MVLTNYGIERMGFKLLSEGEEIKATFHSIQIYSVGEIRIDNFKDECNVPSCQDTKIIFLR